MSDRESQWLPALIDVQQVATLVGCSPRHVHRLSDAGRMPAPIRLGSLSRWNRTSIESWIADGCPATAKGGDKRPKNPSRKQAAVIRKAQRALLKTLLAGAPIVTADQIRDKVMLPKGIDPKCFGCVPRPLAKKGIIMPVGFVNSIRAVAHARTLRIWRLRDRVAAEKWLKTHPEIKPNPPGGAGRLGTED